MNRRKKCLARKATWLAFGLIVLSAISTYAQEQNPAPETGSNHVSYVVDMSYHLERCLPANIGLKI
jgi:hypothetical protein